MRAWGWLLTILFTVALAAVASGIYFRDSPMQDQQLPYMAAMWPIYVLTYGWMKADARAHNVATPPGAIPIIALLPPIAVFYYLTVTRRRLRKVLSAALFCGFFVVIAAVMQFGQLLGARISA